MATLNRNILGDFSGKIGDIVFRQVHNKILLCSKPARYNTSNSENAIYTRNRFINLSVFASFLNKIEVVKNCWKESNTAGTTSYKKILRANSPLMEGRNISITNRVLPEKYAEAAIILSVEKDILTIIIKKRKFNSLRIIVIAVFQKPIKKLSSEIRCHKIEMVFTDFKENYTVAKDVLYLNLEKEYSQVIFCPVVINEYKGQINVSYGKFLPAD